LHDCLSERLRTDGSSANSSTSSFQRRRKRSSETTAGRSVRSDYLSIDSGDEEENDSNEFKLLSLASRLAGTGDDVQNNNNKVSKCAEHDRVHDSFDRLSRYSKDDSGSSNGAARRLSGYSEGVVKTYSSSSDCTSYRKNSHFSETVTCKSKCSAFISIDSGSDDDDKEFRFLPLASRVASCGMDVAKKSEIIDDSHNQVSIGQLSYVRAQSISTSDTASHQCASEMDANEHRSGICEGVLGEDLHQRVSTNAYTAVIDKKKRMKASKSKDPEVLVSLIVWFMIVRTRSLSSKLNVAYFVLQHSVLCNGSSVNTYVCYLIRFTYAKWFLHSPATLEVTDGVCTPAWAILHRFIS